MYVCILHMPRSHDIQGLSYQGQGPYAAKLKSVDIDIKEIQRRINEKLGQSSRHHDLCPLNAL